MNNKEKIIAVVPVKLKSDRVRSKNFREFIDGKSLFNLLLNKLILTKQFDQIYISSNSIDIKSDVEKLGCILSS